jgi:uncharacterized membrane protein YuzA (DUF378 family)
MGDYQGQVTPQGPTSNFGLMTFLYLILGLTAIYYFYRFLNTSSETKTIVLVGGKREADIAPEKIPSLPTPYEGGEYSFNTWLYISSMNKNLNTLKHIFEIQGDNFSTLLVALGAFNNTLVVRTHTIGVEGFQPVQVSGGPYGGSGPAGSGSGSGPAGSGPRGSGSAMSAIPPNASISPGNLSAAAIKKMFTPMAMNDQLLTTPAICDLPEIDMQRWTMVTVVLSGRTIDVYLDGKLSRSCMGTSYYKVDPTGVNPVIAARGGFDGYIGMTSVGNYAMNPDEIYRAYLSGPEGSSTVDFVGWFTSLIRGSS